ncbi:hypothetical protein [uncultured Algoriphagus sp.]|uniref:hypothetical protein n=1 Tax=uncultured Algoriphagus sp. TaxID=417365 RepID=UPI0030EB1E06|tara:strand:+ start:771 stop:1136 length:366 start_codon:yes stop_codon:yes gene_type:complete
MKDLKNITEGFPIADIRSSLYYLGRYIKQAETFENYEKDIFEDGINSEPSIEVKELTKSMIEFVEKKADKKASKFNDDEFHFWMSSIAEFEENIDPEISQSKIEDAMRQIELFELPKKNKT